MTETNKTALGAEFDCLMARAGITIPDGRRDTILAHFADLRTQIALLHAPRPASAEPSNVFRVTPQGKPGTGKPG